MTLFLKAIKIPKEIREVDISSLLTINDAMKKNFTFILSGLLYLHFAQAQEITILQARKKAEGDTVVIRGIITADEFGNQKYLQDPTAGIAIYSDLTAGLVKGDSVLISGIIKNYYGELELSPVVSFQLISQGNQLPLPKVLNFNSGFTETYAGQLLRFNDANFTVSGSFEAGTSGKNYKIYQNGVEKEVRIKPQTNLPGKAIPSGKFDIIGIMSHYKSGSTDIYQLLPRGFSDIIILKGPVIELGPVQSDIQQNSFTVSFTTREAGNTIVRYGLTKQLELPEIINPVVKTTHEMTLTGLSPATFYYVQVASVKGNDTSFSGIYYYSTASNSAGKIKVYFNNPVNTSFASLSQAKYLNKSIDDTLVAYINRAEQSIDMAIYNIDNQNLSSNISQALNAAYQRGVRVRIIGDGSTTNNGLKEISGPIVVKSPQGANYGIMHNKFIVIDAEHSNPDKCFVWTGSTNLTDNQIHNDPNNVIVINDQALARAYTLEFEEMWGSKTAFPNAVNAKFGKFKTDNTPHLFNVGGTTVELYFSPSDQVNTRIINFLKTAEEDIYFALYTFTRTEIANQIIYRKNAGAYTAGIFGEVGGSSSAAYDVLHPALGDSLIKVYSKSNIFHHKYCVIDQSNPYSDPQVLTGSHNWSKSADESNDENTLIVHSQEVANWYLQEWAQRFMDEGGKVFIGFEPINLSIPTSFSACIFGNKLMIHSNSAESGLFHLNLYDLQGKLVFQSAFEVSEGNTARQFILPGLSGSIYLLNIQNLTSSYQIKLISR